MDQQNTNQVMKAGYKSLTVTLGLGFTLLSSLINMGCEKGDRSFSLLSESEVFEQKVAYVPRPVDILWVIDNSGSMESSQRNLTDNFQSFINRFQTLNTDFHMGVAASDAYLGKFRSEDHRRRLRDGTPATGSSGVFVMDRQTPQLSNVFLQNATQGIDGNGDERAFASFLDTLDYNGNSDFLRPGAFLSIIIVSDEDDFSATTSQSVNQNYNSSRIVPLSHYTNFLNNLVGAGNYSVNVITIMDDACLASLQDSSQIKARRYLQLADLTGGVKASLCDNFADSLEFISESTLAAASSFQLSREPIVSTIKIIVNGTVIPQAAVNGWSYKAEGYTLTFNGSAIPKQGDDVQVTYDPIRPK